MRYESIYNWQQNWHVLRWAKTGREAGILHDEKVRWPHTDRKVHRAPWDPPLIHNGRKPR